jgi:HK97 family phage major capsid protein
MNLTEMKARYGFLGDKLKELKDKEERTKEDYEQMKKLMADMDSLKEEIETEQRVQEKVEELEASEKPPEEPPKKEERIEYPEPEKFKTFGEFAQAVIRAGMPQGSGYVGGQPSGTKDVRLKAYEQRIAKELRATGASEAVPSDGGFMLQPEYSNEFLSKTWEVGQLLNKCRKVSLSPQNNSLKIPGVDEASRAEGSRYGGVRAYWADEAAQMTSSFPKLELITLTPNKLTGLCYLTDELLQDAPALEAYMKDAFADEFAAKIDDEIYQGDGSGKPSGVLNANCVVSITKETGQASTTIVLENLTKAFARFWPKGRQNGVWVANQDTIPQLMTLVLPVGTGGSSVMLVNAKDSPVFTIFGMPVLFHESASTLGTAGDIMLCDFSQYMIVDKGGMQSASSIHLKFDYNEIAFRFIYRIDGQPRWTTAVTPLNGTNTISPFIKIASR